jgi:hypothetical protein
VKQSKLFKINEVYQAEVDRLLNSRNKSRTIHGSGNIAASGDELEEPFRAVLRRRLPSKFFIGHGHVVDEELNVSPQFDIVIADNNATPILFEGENGLQYFPWESVYAIGEIKSTYAATKQPIETFAKNIRTLKRRLKRENTPSNYLGNDLFLGKGLSLDDDRIVRNPLFHFIVFFDSGNISTNSLFWEYNSVPDEMLPLGTFFLDGHMVAKAQIVPIGENDFKIGDIYFDPLRAGSRRDIDWVKFSFKKNDRGGQVLAMLMLALSAHLNRCVLKPPSLGKYLKGIMRQMAYGARFIGAEWLVELMKERGEPESAEKAAALAESKRRGRECLRPALKRKRRA